MRIGQSQGRGLGVTNAPAGCRPCETSKRLLTLISDNTPLKGRLGTNSQVEWDSSSHFSFTPDPIGEKPGIETPENNFQLTFFPLLLGMEPLSMPEWPSLGQS